jgi:hypothetical protein
MNRYRVFVSGYAYTEVEAPNAEEAEEVARHKIVSERFGIWDMQMSFVCDEDDLIEVDVPTLSDMVSPSNLTKKEY